MNKKSGTIRLFTSLTLGMILFSGCAGIDDTQKPAPELLKEANADFDSGHYDNALKTYENLRDWYPFSPLAPEVEIKIADTYFKMEKYEEAVAYYEEFIRLHPKNKASAYALYQTGMCYFEQMEDSDRDQIPGYRAAAIFEKITLNDPDAPYSKEASEKVKKCYQNLAASEIKIAEFYYKLRQYEAALNRYERVVRLYPDVGMHEEALSKIKTCRQKIAVAKKNPEEEKPIEFPSATQM